MRVITSLFSSKNYVPRGTSWIQDPTDELWQTIGGDGRTIRIYYNYTGRDLKHPVGEPAQENLVEATCTAEGSYDEVIRCRICGKEISSEHMTAEMLPHTPAEPVQENVVEATCTAEGSYDEVVTCSVCGTELSRTPETLEMLSHTMPDEPEIENLAEATCTEDGSYDTVFRCTVCGVEILRMPVVVDKKGHVPGEAVTENNIDPTCTKEGSYLEETYTLPECGFDSPDGMTFTGWQVNGAGDTLPAGEKVTLSGDTELTAVWKYEFGTADMTLPGDITKVEESAFEGMPVKAVLIGDSCAAVGSYAFRGCTNLIRLRLPRDCAMGDGVLEGCGAVVIFAPAGGTTEAWAQAWIASHPDCVFQPE